MEVIGKIALFKIQGLTVNEIFIHSSVCSKRRAQLTDLRWIRRFCSTVLLFLVLFVNLNDTFFLSLIAI